MPVPTVAEVLAMPAMRGAGPEVVAGQQGLGRQVRWVHSAELADIAPLLRGGDLLLSTGITGLLGIVRRRKSPGVKLNR